jgi:hypothetical protein
MKTSERIKPDNRRIMSLDKNIGRKNTTKNRLRDKNCKQPSPHPPKKTECPDETVAFPLFHLYHQ